jgi:aryl-alcohol dehydrogenase-like predicted oxidoreductase
METRKLGSQGLTVSALGLGCMGMSDPEAEILPTVRALGIGFVAYSPLGRGFLTGAIHSADDLAANDWRRQNPRFQGENLQRNLALVDRVGALAKAKGITAAQLALAWVLSRGRDVVPIPGTRHRKRLEENVAAAAVKLTPDELARLEQAAPPGAAAGTRYPEAGMKSVGI